MGKHKGRILSAAEYIKLYSEMKVNPRSYLKIDRIIDVNIMPNKNRYVYIRELFLSSTKNNSPLMCYNDEISTTTSTLLPNLFNYNQFYNNLSITPRKLGIPWYVIALIHGMECDFSFNKHLYNGDPLTDYTKKVPAGYPKVNHKPGFTFEESAVGALKYQGFEKVDYWNVPVILRNLEGFNGFGYELYHKMNSPYLWAGSNIYKSGKYTDDGKFDPRAVSNQIGVAVILKRMEMRALITIDHN